MELRHTSGMDEEDSEGTAREEEAPALTDLQRKVARLLVHIDVEEYERLDAVFGLPSGTIAGWLDVDAFYELVGSYIDEAVMEDHHRPDYGRSLGPRQRRAAHLMAIEGMSQKDAAAEVGRSDRTLREWQKDWFFQMFMEQLEKEQKKEENRKAAEEYNETTGEIRRVLHRGALDAAKGLVERARDGDVRAQAELLRSWLKRRS